THQCLNKIEQFCSHKCQKYRDCFDSELMDRKTVDRILKAVDDQFPIFEANNWDEAMKITEKTFKWFLDNLRNRSQLEAIFCEASEPTPDELEDILYNIEYGAGILRRLFMAFVKKY